MPKPDKSKLVPREELERVLDAEHADAVIEHRRAKGAKLTGYAAKLLAGKFAKCADPNEAADCMIVNGWQGFEPEWMERRKPKANGTRHAPAFFDTPEPVRKKTPEELAKAAEMVRRTKALIAGVAKATALR